jgi:hypothetical protein
MSENTREVNVPEEQDEEETIVSAEQAQSLEQEPESSTGGGNTEAEPDLVDETKEAEPEKVDAPVEPLEPKPVEGETPREYALRKEIERLRQKNRDILRDSVTSKTKAPESQLDISDLIAEGYTEAEIESSKKLISKLAPSLGFINKSQTYQETANQVLESFIEEHQEYSPKNDKDDVRWSKFIEIIKNDYNLNNKTPKQLKAIYEKVDRDVKGEFGEAKLPNQDNKLKAQVQKIQSVSHTGGNKSITQSKKSSPVREADGVKFIGFEDDEL